MVKLRLHTGFTNRLSIPEYEEICLTNEEASSYLEDFLTEKGPRYAKEWMRAAKGLDEEDISS